MIKINSVRNTLTIEGEWGASDLNIEAKKEKLQKEKARQTPEQKSEPVSIKKSDSSFLN